MTFEALIALALFAIGALAVTSLSIRQLVATRYAARALARDQLVESTIGGLESSPYTLELGRKSMDPAVVDGLSFRRDLQVVEEESGKILLLTLSTWIEDAQGKRISPVWSFEKRILRL